jgi:hypothetical protein
MIQKNYIVRLITIASFALFSIHQSLCGNFSTIALPIHLQNCKKFFHLRSEGDQIFSAYVEDFSEKLSCYFRWNSSPNSTSQCHTQYFQRKPNQFYLGSTKTTHYFRGPDGILKLAFGNNTWPVHTKDLEAGPQDHIHAEHVGNYLLLVNNTKRLAYILDNETVKKVYLPGPLKLATQNRYLIGVTQDGQNIWAWNEQYHYFKHEKPHASRIKEADLVQIYWVNEDATSMIYSVNQSLDGSTPQRSFFRVDAKVNKPIEVDEDVAQSLLYPITVSRFTCNQIAWISHFADSQRRHFLSIDPSKNTIRLLKESFIEQENLPLAQFSGTSVSLGKIQPHILLAASVQPKTNNVFTLEEAWQPLKNFLGSGGNLSTVGFEHNLSQEGLLSYDKATHSMVYFGRMNNHLCCVRFNAATQLPNENSTDGHHFVSATRMGIGLIFNETTISQEDQRERVRPIAIFDFKYFSFQLPNEQQLMQITKYGKTDFICDVKSGDEQHYGFYSIKDKSITLPPLPNGHRDACIQDLGVDMAVGFTHFQRRKVPCYWKRTEGKWRHFPISTTFCNEQVLQYIPDIQKFSFGSNELTLIHENSKLMVGNVFFRDLDKYFSYVTSPLKRCFFLPCGNKLQSTLVQCISDNGLALGGKVGSSPCIWFNDKSQPSLSWKMKTLEAKGGSVHYLSHDGTIACGEYKDQACLWAISDDKVTRYYLHDLLRIDQADIPEGLEFDEVCYVYSDQQTVIANGRRDEKGVCYKIRLNKAIQDYKQQ